MSESGFSRFLIHCTEFNFDFLNSIILKQSNELGSWSSVSSTKKLIQMNKRMSEQPHLHKFNDDDILRSIAQNRSDDIMEGCSADASQKRLKT